MIRVALAVCCVLLVAPPLSPAQVGPSGVALDGQKTGAPPSPAPWRARGIGGGGALFSASISPHDPDVVSMATDMSSVFLSTDFGRAWQMLPFQSVTGGIDTTVRFTSSPDELYAITLGPFDERIAVRSVDGGASFQPLPGDPASGETFTLLADPTTTQRALLATWDQLYFSADAGASFSLAYDASSDGSGLVLAGSFFDGNQIFVGTNQGLLVSSNGGTSFAVDNTPGIPSGQAITSFSAAKVGGQVRLFALTFPRADVWGGVLPWDLLWSRPRLHVLDWGAASWTKVFDGTGNQHPVFIATAQNDRDVIYLAGGHHGTGDPLVLRSANGGGSWQSVLLTTGNQNVATGWMGSGGDLEWYWAEVVLSVAVAPTDPDRIVITDYGFCHTSDDGGASWLQAYVDPADENPAGASTPKGGAYATAGTDQTSSWWLHWSSPDDLLAGFSDIRGIRSTDGGEHFVAGTSLGLPHNSTYHVVAHPSGALYAATSSVHDIYQSTYLQDGDLNGGTGRLIRSIDDGASWQTVHDFGNPVIWLALDPADPDTLYASVIHSSAGGIFVTHDLTGAAGFAKLPAPPRTQGHPFNVHVLNDGALVSSWSARRNNSGTFTTSSGVFYSSNDGASWSDRSHPDMQRWTKDVVIDPHDPTQSTWYAAVFSHWGAFPNEVGGILKSTDRGLSWTRISDSYRVESLTIDPADADRAWYTTESEGLWQSTDFSSGTPTFSRDETYPFKHPMRVFLNPFRPGELWCTSFGGGLRKR